MPRNLHHTIPLLASALALVLAGGVYAFLFFSVQSDVARITRAAQDSSSLTRRDERARSVETLLNETKDKRTALAVFVVDDEDVVSVIELLENVAAKKKTSLSISSVSVSRPSEWNYHERIDIVFSVDGPFANLIRFLATLEALPLASRVESGSLEASGGSAWFASFAMTFVKEQP